MDKSERIFLWLLAIGLAALVIWELRSRNTPTPIDVQESGVSGEGMSIAPRGSIGPAYMIYNQPAYQPGPPQFNVMPAMAKALALNNSGCYTCGG